MTKVIVKWFPYYESPPHYWNNFIDKMNPGYPYPGITVSEMNSWLEKYNCIYQRNTHDKTHPNRDTNNIQKKTSVNLIFDSESDKLAFILEWS